MSEDKELGQHMSRLMNPRVREVEVGTRTLRKIKLYPLSLADQFSLSDSITEGLQVYVQEAGAEFSPQAASKIVELVRSKLPSLLKLIFCDEEPDALLKEFDNYQLATVAELVFNDNYGDPAKKLASLFRPKSQTAQTESAMERLSQLSVGTTPATESNTSPDSATKKVDVPTVN
jgi:hypothetical protein